MQHLNPYNGLLLFIQTVEIWIKAGLLYTCFIEIHIHFTLLYQNIFGSLKNKPTRQIF